MPEGKARIRKLRLWEKRVGPCDSWTSMSFFSEREKTCVGSRASGVVSDLKW